MVNAQNQYMCNAVNENITKVDENANSKPNTAQKSHYPPGNHHAVYL